ncbi:MAG: hydroxymethylglutaryl-CoA lyase, partial [Chloroflexota bacterium]
MKGIGNLPDRVRIYEVGPRDGLQNESKPISKADKVRFIDLLSAAGLPAIEITSFVRPGAIPQLADAGEVAASISRTAGTLYTALVPNIRGMDRAREVGLNGIAVFTAASETFSQRNTNASIAAT